MRTHSWKTTDRETGRQRERRPLIAAVGVSQKGHKVTNVSVEEIRETCTAMYVYVF